MLAYQQSQSQLQSGSAPSTFCAAKALILNGTNTFNNSSHSALAPTIATSSKQKTSLPIILAATKLKPNEVTTNQETLNEHLIKNQIRKIVPGKSSDENEFHPLSTVNLSDSNSGVYFMMQTPIDLITSQSTASPGYLKLKTYP